MCRSSSLIFIALLVSLVDCKPLEPQNAATAAQSVNTADILSDPKLMAALAQFLQQWNSSTNSVVQPPQSPSENQNASVQPQAEGAVAVTQPLVTIIPAPQNSTIVETVVPAQQLQTGAQQTAPVQAQPEATVPVTKPVMIEEALQNPPSEVAEPSVVVAAAPQNPPNVDTRAPFSAEQPQEVAQQPPAVQAQPQIQVTTASQNLPSQTLVQLQQPQVLASHPVNFQIAPPTQPQTQPLLVQQTVPVQVQPQAPTVQAQPQVEQVTTVTASENVPSQSVVQLQQPQVLASHPLNFHITPPQNSPNVDTRASFPAEQPQAAPQQSSAVQAQPQMQQVTTATAFQNPPSQTAVQPQEPQVPATQPLIFQITPPTQPQAQPSLFQHTEPVQVQPQATPQPQSRVFAPQNPTQNQPQTQVQPTGSSTFPQWPSQQLTTPQVNPQQWPNTPIEVAPQSQENVSTQKWGNVRIVTHPRTYVYTPDPLTPEQQKKQAMSAQYQFSTYMDDNIKGSFMARAETRNGLKVYGQYGYDDGFVQRAVIYEADDKGFRIIKDTMKPSTKTGTLDGTATVQIVQDGTQVDYKITSQDIGSTKKVIV